MSLPLRELMKGRSIVVERVPEGYHIRASFLDPIVFMGSKVYSRNEVMQQALTLLGIIPIGQGVAIRPTISGFEVMIVRGDVDHPIEQTPQLFEGLEPTLERFLTYYTSDDTEEGLT